MSLAVVHSRGLIGVEAPPVSVEVHIGNGLPAFHIVGLPEAEVRESRERVRAALLQTGFRFPNHKLTVNLAPADLPKASGRFDLPIAVGILAASAQVPPDALDDIEFVGELSLSGAIRPIRGALVMALAIVRSDPSRALLLPLANCAEAALASDARLYGVEDLAGVAAHLIGSSPLARVEPRIPAFDAMDAPDDLSEVKGHVVAKRALEVAAAGAHNLLMVGPPGAGKSLLAQRMPGIQPPMDSTEAIESAALASLLGAFDPQQWARRPFRAPHHGASTAALIGGGSVPRPGEVSLAHHGVLFLDELPEFSRMALEALREPLETGRITVARALRRIEFPARFQLVAAMNPCPCGYFGDSRCRCTPDQIRRYRGKLSGPLLDRIDLLIEVVPVSEAELMQADGGENSACVASRVEQARQCQQARQQATNAQLSPSAIARHCALDAGSADLLRKVAQRQRWSSRALHRVQKVARTIADLAGAASIDVAHVAEAISYRRALH